MKVVGWAVRIYIAGLCAMCLITFASDVPPRHGLLISPVVWTVACFAILGFVLFPIFLFRYLNDIYLLAFDFEQEICRSDGDFFDWYDFDTVAFSGAIYAFFSLLALVLSPHLKRCNNPLLVWILALGVASAFILLTQSYMPNSMGDCFR
jgi:hypothetical protein